MQFNMPKNFKRGQFYFNSFRAIDLIIGITGTVLSLILILIYLLGFNGRNVWMILLLLLFPGLVCVILVIPMPNYHNVMELLKIWVNWTRKKRKYVWRGIVKYDDYKTADDES